MHSRSKVTCHCSKCNGKLIDPSTRKKHMEIENQMETWYESSLSKVNKAVPKRNQTDDNDENTSNPSNPSNPSESSNSTSSSNSSSSSDSTEELGSEQRPISVQTERKRNKKIKALLESVIDDDSYLDPMLSDEESVSNDERSEISENSDNDENIIDEQFTAPDWDDFDDIVQVPSFLNLGYYYGYININQGFAYLMLQ